VIQAPRTFSGPTSKTSSRTRFVFREAGAGTAGFAPSRCAVGCSIGHGAGPRTSPKGPRSRQAMRTHSGDECRETRGILGRTQSCPGLAYYQGYHPPRVSSCMGRVVVLFFLRSHNGVPIETLTVRMARVLSLDDPGSLRGPFGLTTPVWVQRPRAHWTHAAPRRELRPSPLCRTTRREVYRAARGEHAGCTRFFSQRRFIDHKALLTVSTSVVMSVQSPRRPNPHRVVAKCDDCDNLRLMVARTGLQSILYGESRGCHE
jgi:hypothetical protein